MLHFRNFDALRLIAASSVILSHSFLIADGHERNEPFVGVFGHILGIYGVFVFFISVVCSSRKACFRLLPFDHFV